eukprot:14176709-Ditylum_brightwellii.AAC.1
MKLSLRASILDAVAISLAVFFIVSVIVVVALCAELNSVIASVKLVIVPDVDGSTLDTKFVARIGCVSIIPLATDEALDI